MRRMWWALLAGVLLLAASLLAFALRRAADRRTRVPGSDAIPSARSSNDAPPSLRR